jgi:hypothetical protein
MLPFVDGQAFDRWHQQPAPGVHFHLAPAGRLRKPWIRGIEVRASAPHHGELLQVVHPQIAAAIAADTHPFSLWETLCLAEEGDLLSCPAAQTGAAAVPQGTCLQENSVRVRAVCAGRRGEQAKGKTAAFHRSCRHDKATHCADEGSAFAVELDRTVAVYASARERYSFKTVALLLVEAPPVPRQQASIRRLAETQGYLVRKTLSRPVALKPLAIVTEHAVFRSGPQKARPILKEDFHGQIGQTIFCSVIAETVLLGLYRHSESEAGEGGGETQDRFAARSQHLGYIGQL